MSGVAEYAPPAWEWPLAFRAPMPGMRSPTLLLALAVSRWYPLRGLVLGRLGQVARLGLGRAGQLLQGRAVRRLAGQLLHLLISFPACPRADHEAHGEPSEERKPDRILHPLSTDITAQVLTFP